MSYVQLPQGLTCNDRKFKLNLPKNYAASEYIKRFPYLDNAKNPKFQNDAIDVVNNRADLRKFFLATSDYGKNIQDGINSVVILIMSLSDIYLMTKIKVYLNRQLSLALLLRMQINLVFKIQ